jgi:HAD superfamily hydrolase (TIGR01509 family)
VSGVQGEAVEVVLCDADGNLFPSEEPAFVASAVVTNRFLAAHGVSRRFTPEELRLTTTGKNFRTTIADLASACGIQGLTDAELEEWVATERREVTAYLATALDSDDAVIAPLTELADRFTLAVVSSSASQRLDACFTATALDELLPGDVRFSAEDSLAHPTGKPDPAVYRFALEAMDVDADAALAVEDSLPGVQSAVAAGIPTVGNLQFVQGAERAERERQLARAGACEVVSSWGEVAELLVASPAVSARTA